MSAAICSVAPRLSRHHFSEAPSANAPPSMSHAPGTAWAPPQAAALDPVQAVEVGDHDARGADGELGLPLTHHTCTDRRALLVARAPADRDALGQPGLGRGRRRQRAGLPGRDAHRRHAVAVDAAQREDPVAPVELADLHHAVQRQRRGVGDPLSAPMRCRKYSWPLANHRVRPKTSLSLSTEPGDLRSGPQRGQLHARVRLVVLRRDLLAELLLVLQRPAVVPHDRRHEVALVLVQHEDRAALAGQPDRLVRRRAAPRRPPRPSRRHRCRPTPARRPARSIRRGARCTGTPGSPDRAACPVRRRSSPCSRWSRRRYRRMPALRSCLHLVVVRRSLWVRTRGRPRRGRHGRGRARRARRSSGRPAAAGRPG